MTVALAVIASVAWVVANGLDVLSVLMMLQGSARFAFARQHPAEYFMIYVGLRLLGALGFYLVVLFICKHWSSASKSAWVTLTVCALVAAAAAWLRLGT